MLQFSRTNKSEKIHEVSDLNLLFENAKQELNQTIEEKNAEIIKTELPQISVIPFQIQQLFTNIIGNSLKYSKEEISPIIKINSSLVISQDEKKLPKNKDKFYKISIEDNGIGREAAQVIKQKNLSSVLHESKAISIVQERLELLQQKTGKKAGFHIEDLFENGKPSGTRVHIIIPYYTKEET